MNIRKLMLPAVIAALIAAPTAFAQSAQVDAQAEVDAQAAAEQAASTAGDVVGDASALVDDSFEATEEAAATGIEADAALQAEGQVEPEEDDGY